MESIGVRLSVTPSPALVDEPLGIVVSGGRPGGPVTVRARMRDGLGRQWASHAVFEAGREGEVDVATHRPIAGTYGGTDARGLLWSMQLVEGQPSGGWTNASPLETEITAESEGPLASAHVSRLFYGWGASRTEVRDNGLVATLFRPAGTEPRPAVIVVPGSGGGVPEGSAALLASYGFVGLALAYFRAGHLPESLAEIPLEYFETAIGWLRDHEAVAGRPVGVMGTSRGGELALLLGSTFGDFKAVVGYVPSGVAHAGISGGGLREARRRPAWTYKGKAALPFIASRDASRVEEPAPSAEPLALTPIFLKALEDRAAADAAEIPVERINGPVLLISGQDDQMWPSPVLADIAMKRLARHHHRYPYTHLSYPGAGHIIGQPGLPATVTAALHPLAGRSLAYGGHAKDNAAAAADSWPKVLAFFRDALA